MADARADLQPTAVVADQQKEMLQNGMDIGFIA